MMRLSTLVLDGAHAHDGTSPRPTLTAAPRLTLRPGLLALLTFLGAMLATGAAAEQNATPTWVDGDGKPLPGGVEIGDHLEPGLSEVRPNARYRMRLLDDHQSLVREIDVRADELGRIESSLLWRRTGVVGCDEEGKPAADGAYEYVTFADAEQDLTGRDFELHLEDVQSAQVVAQRTVRMNRRQTPLFYFADVFGCPRSDFQDEDDLYLAAEKLPGHAMDFVFFLVDRENPPMVGETIFDIRPGYAGSGQVIEVETGETGFLELLWGGVETECGAYMGLLRHGTDTTPVRRPDDWQLGGSDADRAQDGITVSPWDCPGCGDDDGSG